MSANDVPTTPPKKRPSPPKEFQFKKGVSGNSNGRPPKKRPAATGVANAGEFAFHDSSFLSVAQQEQNRLMSVKEGERSEKMPAFQIVMRRMGVDAAQGSLKAQQTFLKLAAETQGPVVDKMAIFDYWLEYVDKQTFRLVEEVRAGNPMSDVVPHPDDVEFNYEKLEVKINGPLTRREKLYQDAMLAEFSELPDWLRYWEEHLSANPTDKESRKQVRRIKEMIGWCREELEKRYIRKMTYQKLAALKKE
jgi:hypothetical protein